jgi:hypothetical protein
MSKSITPLFAISILLIALGTIRVLPAEAQTPQLALVAATAATMPRPAASSWGSPPINFAASVKVSLLKTDPIPAPLGSGSSWSVQPVGLRIPDSQLRNPDILVRN